MRSGSRRSTRINKDNVKNLKLAYAVAIGGTAANENLQSTPLAEDGFLYVVDQWGIVYKIDARSGDMGRIVWRMDPGQEKAPLSNRGAALWGNLVISLRNYPARVIATDKDTGKVVWETNVATASPTCSSRRRRLRSRTRSSSAPPAATAACATGSPALDAKTGKLVWHKYVIPAPGEPGSETWKDKNNAWQTGGGAMWITGTYDVATNQVIWGTGNPVPMFDPTYRPGDNLFTNSVISWNPDDGKMNWYFQYTPGDMWDYDEAGTHILIDGQINGAGAQAGHAFGAQRLPLHDRAQPTARPFIAKPYVDNINWTKGIDQKTGKPVDYDPKQGHPGLFRHAEPDARRIAPRSCVRRCRAATTTGRRPTARRPSCSTFRR